MKKIENPKKIFQMKIIVIHIKLPRRNPVECVKRQPVPGSKKPKGVMLLTIIDFNRFYYFIDLCLYVYGRSWYIERADSAVHVSA